MGKMKCTYHSLCEKGLAGDCVIKNRKMVDSIVIQYANNNTGIFSLCYYFFFYLSINITSQSSFNNSLVEIWK